uniref:AMP-dependent synthetase/ligase domain-containing protein n=1 Tax=Quercus lobata TaxID=97700 RepID=A0A7N2R3X8_QUELO
MAVATFNPKTQTYTSPRPPIHLPSNPNLFLTSFLIQNSSSSPHSLALIDVDSGETLTFRQLKLQVSKLPHSLLHLNVHTNDVVLIIAPNSIHFPVCFLAIVAFNAVNSSFVSHLHPTSTTTIATTAATTMEFNSRVSDAQSATNSVESTHSAVHKNVELAEEAIQHLLELDPLNEIALSHGNFLKHLKEQGTPQPLFQELWGMKPMDNGRHYPERWTGNVLGPWIMAG